MQSRRDEAAARRVPAGRYGPARAPGPMLRYVAIGVAMAVAVGVAVVLALRHASPVDAGLRGFRQLPGGHAVRIEFDVRKPPERAARCLVRARDADGREVGRAEVPVGPSGRGAQVTTVTYTLTISHPAVTGEVTGCRLVDAG